MLRPYCSSTSRTGRSSRLESPCLPTTTSTLETQLARIEGGQTMLAEEKGALFGVFLREDDELVGFLGLYA